MPLPEKEYYSFQEIASRWQTSLEDIQYYAVHGQLEVMTWVDIGVINIYRLKKTEDGECVSVLTGLSSYKDYALVASKELRQIFRSGSHILRSFLTLKDHSLIEIHNGYAGYEVTNHDLVIHRRERDRFEHIHALSNLLHNEQKQRTPVKSYPGRPSSMYQVQKHFLERCHQKAVLPSLQQEATYLSHWALDNIKDFHPPKAKSIMNAIRDYYRQHMIGLIPAVAQP